MSELLVKIDNDFVWDGIQRPFFENYFLKICDPFSCWSLCLYFFIDCPSDGVHPGISRVLASYVTTQGEKILVQNDYDLHLYDIVHTDPFLKIHENILTLADCMGCVEHEKNRIKWDFRFEDPVLSSRPISKTLQKFSKIKFFLPRLLSFVSGDFYVNHKKHSLNRVRVTQGHMVGPRIPSPFSLAHCVDFPDDPLAYFEALCWPTPLKEAHFFCVGMEGQAFRADSLSQVFWRNRSVRKSDHWQLQFFSRGFRFDCQVTQEPQLKFHFPFLGGVKPLQCQSTMMADIEIQVLKRHRGRWQEYKQLKSSKKCTWEEVSPLQA